MTFFYYFTQKMQYNNKNVNPFTHLPILHESHLYCQLLIGLIPMPTFHFFAIKFITLKLIAVGLISRIVVSF